MAHRNRISKRVRFSVFARDAFTCVYCGRQPPTVTLELEHMTPVAQGGTDEETNLRAACVDCNAGKAAKTVLQIVPTEFERLKQAQELAEKRQQLEELSQCAKAAAALEQEVCNQICNAIGETSCKKASITLVSNLIGEFGAESVLSWLRMAAARVRQREIPAMKYLCGIARQKRGGA